MYKDTSVLPPWLFSQFRQALSNGQLPKALADILEGWNCRSLWGTIALHDIRQRYRRSLLGPFWITISMGVMVSALGLLYGKIFGVPLDTYLPYLSAGFVTWGFISGLILDGSKAFISAEMMMRQLTVPISTYVYRVVWSNLIIFAHNIWIYVVIAIWFDVEVGWSLLLAVPALLLLAINGLWVGILVGLLSARFRDIPLIVGSVVQVMFFITPVIWKPDMLPGRALLLDANPFYHFVAIFRAPLIGGLPTLENWLAALLVTAVGWLLALGFYTAYRWRVVYWV